MSHLSGQWNVPHQRSGRVGGIALLVVFVVAVLLAPACDADRAEAVRYYNEGMQAFQGESTSAAVQYMEQALEEDPTFHVAAFTLGQIQQQRMDNPDEAEHNYRQALDHDPDNEQYAYRLGSALADQGEHEEAIEHFEEAIALDEGFARAWYEKGMSLDGAGQPLEAAEALMESIRIQPRLRLAQDDPGGEHYHALADLYLRYRLYDHAVDVYENGVRNNPDSPRLHHGLGVALMELDRHEEAVESFRETLEIDENHPSANFNIAVALHEADRTEDAIAQLDELTRGGQGMTEARMAAAEALLDDLEAELEEDED